ncbi:MAG: peptidase [Hyphomicrobiales bacterium]|nr:peptidase [Hyphomicrobiales bacterium]
MTRPARAARPGAPTPRRSLLAAALALLTAGGPALAQERNLNIIRDGEIEQLLRDYTAPIFRTAGIKSSAAKVILIGDRSFNAFVANGQKIFVNAGAIMESKTPNELIGVLAHETGHIAGGHLARQRMELANAAIMSVAGMLMSAGAIAATARNRNVGTDGGGMLGTMLGPQEIVRRSLLAYQRGEEQAADIAAVKYLAATGQSARGLLATMERFQSESLFKTSSIDPYLLSHPLPRERISNLQEQVGKSASVGVQDSPALQMRHDMARAKLVGFIGNVSEISRRYPLSDATMPGRYARAISAYRFGRLNEALAQIDQLIAANPKNPWFHELKGQALLEAGRAGQAVEPLKRAVAMAPYAVPVRIMLGHAYVASNNPASTDQAISILSRAAQQEEENADAYQFLAMAYERKGNQAQAMLSAAQGLFISGKFIEARTQADRAKRLLPERSPGWLKADDILNYRPPKD